MPDFVRHMRKHIKQAMAKGTGRYFFHLPDGSVVTIERPKDHPRFVGMVKGRAGVLFDKTVVWGVQGRATQKDSVACTTSCKKATEAYCICSCGGKNHGIWHKGPLPDSDY